MLKDDILGLLTPDVFVSGAGIADALGVTRAAVSKAVRALCKDGYAIEGVKNRGYCLRGVPDRLSSTAIRALLAGHPLAQNVTVYDTVDSTNTLLKHLASNDAPVGTAVVAEQQTQGRGRLGRRFASPPNAGVYLSVLLRPDCGPAELMTLTAQTAVAVRRAIFKVCGIETAIKWVNDLFLDGKKICGILTELSVEAENGHVNHAIVGVGVNCNGQPDDYPEELRGIAGSILSQRGVHVDRNRLAAELLLALSELPSIDWRDEYRAHCLTLGRQVEIVGSGGRRMATAVDIGPNAELMVRYADGSTSGVNSGEVLLREHTNKS